MSKYSREKQPSIGDSKIRANNRLVDKHNPNIIINNSTPNGVDLLFPKTTIIGSSFQHNSSETIPVVITTTDQTSTKDDNYVALVDSGNKPDTLATTLSNKTNKEQKTDIDEYKNDYITQFYVGSLTIVGVYIVYRIIQRTR